MSAKFCQEHNRYHHVDEPCPYCEISNLTAVINRIKIVRDDLATQTLNSHAVRLIDRALKGENHASTTS